jgi:hypothetical protein
MPRVLLEDRELRRRLGDISRTGLKRLRALDPRCPRPTKVMGKNVTDEAAADVYIELLLAEGEPRQRPRELGAKWGDDPELGAGASP